MATRDGVPTEDMRISVWPYSLTCTWLLCLRKVLLEYMLVHLREMFEDVEVYRWKVIREYHAA